MRRLLADVLVDFSLEAAPPVMTLGDWSEPDMEFPLEEQPPEPGLSEEERLAAAVAEAHEAGMAEGMAQAQAEWEARLSAVEAERESHVAASREHWAAAESAVLAEVIQTGFARIEENLAGALAAVMMPVLQAGIRARAADEMADAVRQLLTGGAGVLINIGGPEDLMNPLRETFADNTAVSVHVSDQPEASARAGDSAIASQVGAWTARLQAALENAA